MSVFGLKAGHIPSDVILIIMAVISLISAMQVAGGMDYLVVLAEKLIRSKPKQVTFLSPFVTYCLTLLAGTGHTAFAVLPVISEVAKEQNIRPSKALSISVVASQIAITASPISAAVVFFAQVLENYAVSYLELLAISIPSSFLACFMGAIVSHNLGSELKDDPIFQERLKKGLIYYRKQKDKKIAPSAKKALFIFLLTVMSIVLYAALISPRFNFLPNPGLDRNQAIIAFCLFGASLICYFCPINVTEISSASIFKSGMTACICVLGVAWLGDTFISNHINEIKSISSEILEVYPWLLAFILFFSSMLLYSQAATTKALMPLALVLGVSPASTISCFCAVSALFILPTYPTLVAAIEIDDTGSTRIGRYIFDHPFVLPGITSIIFGVLFAHILASMIL